MPPDEVCHVHQHIGQVVVAVFLATVLGAAHAPAQEKRVKRSDLPAAVQQTVAEQSKGATVQGYTSETENGQQEYEVEMTVHGRSRDVTIAPDGSVIEVEDQVTLRSLPAEVRDSLVKRAGKGRITKVESLTKGGTLVAYEAQVRTGTKRSEVQVGPKGETLAHEQ
jgi:hypothetical protein